MKMTVCVKLIPLVAFHISKSLEECCDNCVLDGQECLWPEDRWQQSCLECIWGRKTCTLNGKELVLHSPEESRGEGLSKQWKATESPSSDGALVLDALVGLMDEVAQLQEEETQHGELIVSGLEAIPGRLKEERIYLEQDLEENN